jgi:hypothetical protein
MHRIGHGHQHARVTVTPAPDVLALRGIDETSSIAAELGRSG